MIAIRLLTLGAAIVIGSLSSLTPAHAFDHYVLALSWSPTYCRSEAGRDDPRQCVHRNYAFVVHGLWPQFKNGWPEYCAAKDEWVPAETIERMLPIMPSKQLIIRQWKKHGSCSGLSVDDYFALTTELFDKLSIPPRYGSADRMITTTMDQLMADFMDSNQGLNGEMITIDCEERGRRARLSDLRVCFSRSGQFASCGGNGVSNCSSSPLELPSAPGSSP
jgi:ribonuclease T2